MSDGSGTAVDEQQYHYDADANVVSRRNTVLPGQSEAYTYDGLDRLVTFARGTLNSAGTAVAGTPTGTESWNLDAVGNWKSDTTDGVTTTRTNSAQNQIQTVTTPTAGGGNTTATLGYDKDGNTLSDDAGQGYAYDAWNRLVAVTDAGGHTIAGYTYDAQGRRVTEVHPDAAAGTTATTTLVYSDRWQVLDERTVTVDAATGAVTGTAGYQYTWSPFYVDQLVARDTLQPSQLDPTFGAGGVVVQAADHNDPVTDGGVVVLPSGEVVVAATDGVTGDVVLFGYTPAGAVDGSFGAGGSGAGEVDTGRQGTAVGLVYSGVTGDLYVGVAKAGGALTVAAFGTDGSADTSYGSGGVATAAFAYGATTTALTVDGSGDVVVAGWADVDADPAGGTEMAAARFGPDGTLDATFGTGGEVTAAVAGATDTVANTVAVGPDGQVVLAGSADGSAAAFQFDATGAADSPYATDGELQPPSNMAAVTAVGFDGFNDYLFVAGLDAAGTSTAMAKYWDDGALHEDWFGTATWQGPGGDPVVPYALAGGDDQSPITVVGRYLADGQVAAVRFDAYGDVDTTFGTNGLVEVGGVAGATSAAGATWTAAGDLLVTGAGSAVAIAPTPPGSVVPADRLYAEQDADYNVTSLTDATGTLVERYAYDPYGAVTVEEPDGTPATMETMDSLYDWTVFQNGLSVDTSVGLASDRYRDSLVNLNRFAQEDPARYVNGANRYQQRCSNPVDSLDPSGLDLLSPSTAPSTQAAPRRTHAVIGPVKVRISGGTIYFDYGGADMPTFQQQVKISAPSGVGSSPHELYEHGGQDPAQGFVGDNGSGAIGNPYGSDYYGAPTPGWRANGSNGPTPRSASDTPGTAYVDGNGNTYNVRKDFVTDIYDSNGRRVARIKWHLSDKRMISIDETA